MKKVIVLAVTGVLCIVAIRCGKQPETKSEPQNIEVLKEELVEEARSASESVTEAVPASEADIVVDMEGASRSITNKEGVEIVKIEENYPVVIIGSNEEASRKINAFYQKEKEDFEVLLQGYEKEAESDYEKNLKEKETEWYPYEFSKTHELARADSAVISVICEDYSFTFMQAHGETTKSADNFNSETGERLKFADVVTDEKEAKKFVDDFILKTIEENRKKQEFDYYLDDYAEQVPTLLTDDNWYFSQTGFVVIANPYIISAGAAGIEEFTIPYKEFTYLKEEYK